MNSKLEYPFTLDKIRDLRQGQMLTLSGRIFTGRDRLHRYLFDGGRCPVDLADGAVFHCGPALRRKDGRWVAQAAGPTTSIREEPYMAKIIQEHRLRIVIGKGGMGERTRKACMASGCIYVEAVGGAAQVLNARIRKVLNGHFVNEFGATEALWELDVADFPVLVAIDTQGGDLHKRVRAASRRMLAKLIGNGPSFKG